VDLVGKKIEVHVVENLSGKIPHSGSGGAEKLSYKTKSGEDVFVLKRIEPYAGDAYFADIWHFKKDFTAKEANMFEIYFFSIWSGRQDKRFKGEDNRKRENVSVVRGRILEDKGMTLYHGSDKMFNTFENEYIKELGFHFGTKEQALDRIRHRGLDDDKTKERYLYECEVNTKKMFGNGMMDLGTWDYDMIDEYFNPKKGNEEVFTEKEWEGIINKEEFVKVMKGKGYIGIEYINCFEADNGQMYKNSYLVFDAKDIKIDAIYKVSDKKEVFQKEKINDKVVEKKRGSVRK